MDAKKKLNTYLALARMTIVAFEDLQGVLRDMERQRLRILGWHDLTMKPQLDLYQKDLDAYVTELRANIDNFVVREEKIMTDFIDGFHDYLKNRANYYIEKELPKLK